MKTIKESRNKDYRIKGGVTAAGVGTFLIYIVNNLPDENAYKSWLVLIVPFFSFVICALWIWFKSNIEKYRTEKELISSINRAKQTLNEALDNPKTSEEHRRKIRKTLEDLELLIVDIQFSKVKTMAKSRDSEHYNN
jgi:Na+/melibiose symporter-like transporter